jgi:hypothetical protein
MIPMRRARPFMWPAVIVAGLVTQMALASCTSTTAFRGPDGRPLGGSVAEMTDLPLNGLRQRIWLRGASTRNPLLEGKRGQRLFPCRSARPSPPVRGRRSPLTAERPDSDHPRMRVLPAEPAAVERTRRSRRAMGQDAAHDRLHSQPASVQPLLDPDRRQGGDRQGPAPWLHSRPSGSPIPVRRSTAPAPPSCLTPLGLPARRGTCSTIRRSTPGSLPPDQRGP